MGSAAVHRRSEGAAGTGSARAQPPQQAAARFELQQGGLLVSAGLGHHPAADILQGEALGRDCLLKAARGGLSSSNSPP
jgi:hypothetical protein